MVGEWTEQNLKKIDDKDSIKRTNVASCLRSVCYDNIQCIEQLVLSYLKAFGDQFAIS